MPRKNSVAYAVTPSTFLDFRHVKLGFNYLENCRAYGLTVFSIKRLQLLFGLIFTAKPAILAETHIGDHAKCLLLLLSVNQNCNVSTHFSTGFHENR